MSGADCACEKVKMTNTRTSITRRTLSFIRSVTFLRIWWMFQVLLILLCLPAGLCKNYCITQETFDNVVPQFGKDAGTFTLQPEISPPGVRFPLDVKDVISQCVKICCQEDTCDAVYVFEGSCYTLDCVSREACMPIEGKVQGTHMAFIARASPSFSQESFVEPRNLNSECDPKTHQPCPQNEECIGVTGKKGKVNYQCQCVEGYERDSSDACIDLGAIEYGIPSDYESDFNNFNFKNSQKTRTKPPNKGGQSKSKLHFCDRQTACLPNEYCLELFYGTGVCKCKRGYYQNPNTDACEISTTESGFDCIFD